MVHDAPIPATTTSAATSEHSGSVKAKQQPPKRRRLTHDVDGLVQRESSVAQADMRAASGGSPVKKRRTHKDSEIS